MDDARRIPSFIRLTPCSRCGQSVKSVNGANLRFRRLDASISLREMARRLNISAAYLSDVELNRRRATAKLTMAFVKELKRG